MNTDNLDDDELFEFAEDEQAPAVPGSQGTPWKVLMVDDSAEVHRVTRMVLRTVKFLGKSIEFISAYSSAEGRDLLRAHPDAAAVFLDVVMETDHAGLDLVKFIRDEMNNHLIRIILRTGQPGQAPEAEVIVRYDINDYKHKSELSTDRLFSTMIVALRSYHDLLVIDASRKGLERILQGSTTLIQSRSTECFLSGLLLQIQAMFNLGSDAILCARSSPASGEKTLAEPKVLAASGKYSELLGEPLRVHAELGCRDDIIHTFEAGTGEHVDDRYTVYFYSRELFEIVILFEAHRMLNQLEITLIEVYCTTAAVSLSNVHLLETLEKKVEERTNELTRLNSELQVVASTDALTGVLNRRQLFEIGNNLFNTAVRYRRPMAVVMLDLDHFKSINDSLGHLVGDQVLRDMAKACPGSLRQADVFGRYGGEEFIVLCPETDAAAAAVVAERLRLVINKLQVHDDNGQPLPRQISASVGYTSVLGSDRDLYATIKRADQALYRAKGLGRNRVESVMVDE